MIQKCSSNQIFPGQVSLIITTYNWPQALDLVLESVSRQKALPLEVLVADDGSQPPTAQVVASWASRLNVPVRHIWQEDQGFRAARSRNRGIAAASGDYIVMVDGDMVLDPFFIADHAVAAQAGCFVQGVRLLTTPACSKKLLARKLRHIGPFTPGIKRPQHAIRSRWLSHLFGRKVRNLERVKSCNFGAWRADLLKVNGFDERMVGWGPEDKDCAARLLHAGLCKRYLRFAGLATHLYHPTRAPSGKTPNDAIFAETLARKLTRCELGVSEHLAEFAHGIPESAQPPWGRNAQEVASQT